MKDNLFDELRNQAEKYTVEVNNSDKMNGSSEARRIMRGLKERVFGQERATRRLVRSISIFEANLNDPLRPINCLIFAGPSGVGKTFTAKEFGHLWIGEPEEGLDPVVLIACGSLALEHQVTSLTGAPPSYVGYEDEPALAGVGKYDKHKKTKEFRDRMERWLEDHPFPPSLVPYVQQKVHETYQNFSESLKPFRSVVIFDEFEKAHPNIQKELLNILEEGKLRLQNGEVVDFTGSVIILTTNIGTSKITEEYLETDKIGFRLPAKTKEGKNIDTAIWQRVVRETERCLPPELLSRIGGRKGIIVFHVLKHEDYLKILDKELAKVQNMLSGKPGVGLEAPVLLSFSPEFKDFLLEKVESPKYGARILRNVVDKYVKEPLAQRIISGKVRVADKLLFTVRIFEGKTDEEKIHQEGRVIIRRQARPKGKRFPTITVGKSNEVIPDLEEIMEDFYYRFISEKRS